MYKGDVESEMVEKGLGIFFTICLGFTICPSLIIFET